MKNLLPALIYLIFISCGDKHSESFKLANQAIEQGNLELAEKIYTNIITADNDNAAAFNNRAIVRMKLEKYDAAMEDAEKAIDLFHGDEDFQVTKANILYQRGDYKRARQLLQSIIDQGTDLAYPYYLLANVRIHNEDYKGALIDLHTSLKKEPGYQLALKQIPVVYILQEKYEQAIDAYGNLIKDTLHNDQYFANRGFAFLKSGETEKAIADLEKAVRINPQNAYAFNNLGYAQYQYGDTSTALENINYSIQLDDQNNYAYRNRGIIFLSRNQIKKACNEWQKAYSITSTSSFKNKLETLLDDHCGDSQTMDRQQ